MFTGKVAKRFLDKYTGDRYEVGQEYSHKDEKRLNELSKLGFVEYEDEKKPDKIPKDRPKK